jgi:hypothetical protein
MLHDFSPAATFMALDTLRMLRPHKLVGSNKIRLGRLYDGGYVMVDRFEEVEAAYSLGINDDVSWDLDIAARGVPCFQYDPTIEALPQQHPLFNWKSVWIGGEVDRSANRETLENLIVENGHENSRNLLLKCDIEGAEWILLQRTPSRVMRQFSQMVFEIHGLEMLADPYHGNNVRNAFLNLTAFHHVVHVHANNFASWHIVGGVPVPGVIELTLLRKDEGEFELSEETFPTILDMPCHRDRADMYLGRFDFS